MQNSWRLVLSSNFHVLKIYFVFTKYTSDANLLNCWPNSDWSRMEVESPLSLNCLEKLLNNGITIVQDNCPQITPLLLLEVSIVQYSEYSGGRFCFHWLHSMPNSLISRDKLNKDKVNIEEYKILDSCLTFRKPVTEVGLLQKPWFLWIARHLINNHHGFW